jgi:hypothetical protein
LLILKPRLQLIRRTGPDLSDVTPLCGNVHRYNRAHRDRWMSSRLLYPPWPYTCITSAFLTDQSN